MSTCDDHSVLLVSNPHTHIMTVFILQDHSINPTLAQQLPQTTQHIITHYSKLACWGRLRVGWRYHFHCWVLKWVQFLYLADYKHQICGCQSHNNDNDNGYTSDDSVTRHEYYLEQCPFWGFKSSGIKPSVVCLVDSAVLKTLMHYIHYKTLGPLTQWHSNTPQNTWILKKTTLWKPQISHSPFSFVLPNTIFWKFVLFFVIVCKGSYLADV